MEGVPLVTEIQVIGIFYFYKGKLMKMTTDTCKFQYKEHLKGKLILTTVEAIRRQGFRRRNH